MASGDSSRAGARSGPGAPGAVADVVRLEDERRGRGGAPAAPRPPTLADLARRVPDVSHAVLLARSGARLEEGGYEDEVLGGEALFVALLAAELGEALGAGELRSAAIEGSRRHLLVLATDAHLLAVTARADAELGAVDAALRATLPGAR